MTPSTSFPVRYRLIPVQSGDYIETEGQVWADPDPADAAAHLIALVDEPSLGPRLGARAARHMRRNFGDPVVGGILRRRIEDVARGRRG